MTIALTPFLALCGFRPLHAIITALNSTPELISLIPTPILDRFISVASSNEPSENQKIVLKDLFSALMTADETRYKEQLTNLVGRYKADQINDGEEKAIVDLVLRLDSHFPTDIGIWCAFVLNYVTLQPGEAMFLGAGEPHAYIAGGMYIFTLSKNDLMHFFDFQSAWNAWPTQIMLSVQG
jgi:mannose-6-phosphate isomerase